MKKLLWDAEHSASVLAGAVAGHTFNDFTQDEFFRGGVERRLEIIGEALRKATAIDPTVAERITDIRQIINLRHRIAHEYDALEDHVIWDIVEFEVPLLRRELETLVAESS